MTGAIRDPGHENEYRNSHAADDADDAAAITGTGKAAVPLSFSFSVTNGNGCESAIQPLSLLKRVQRDTKSDKRKESGC